MEHSEELTFVGPQSGPCLQLGCETFDKFFNGGTEV